MLSQVRGVLTATVKRAASAESPIARVITRPKRSPVASGPSTESTSSIAASDVMRSTPPKPSAATEAPQ